MYNTLFATVTGNVQDIFVGESGKMISIDIRTSWQNRKQDSDDVEYEPTYVTGKVLHDLVERVNRLGLEKGAAVLLTGVLTAKQVQGANGPFTSYEVEATTLQKLDDNSCMGYHTATVTGVAGIASLEASPNGGVANVGLAHDIAVYNKEAGKTEYVPSYHNGVLRGAIRAAKVMTWNKGDKVHVVGDLITRKVEGKEKPVYITEIVLNHLARVIDIKNRKRASADDSTAADADPFDGNADTAVNDEVLAARKVLQDAERRAAQASKGVAGSTS